MGLLLDTHALTWWLTDNPPLATTARAAIADPDNLVFASAVSGYEIANKQSLDKWPGKLTEFYRRSCVKPAFRSMA